MTPNLRLVFWELTARCNLKCQHCRAEAQDEEVVGELTTDEVLDVARGIREEADPIMVLTGGEPLVRRDFFEIAEACSDMFSRVALATNGTMVDDPMARRIVDAGIKMVSISIDGANAATHDEFRRLPGSFDAALAGFDALKAVGSPVQINCTVARHNIDELEALLELVLAKGANAFHVFVLVPVGCGVELDDSIRLSGTEVETVLHWLFEKSLALRGKLHIKATCAPQYYRIMNEETRKRGLDVQGSGHGMHAVTRGCLAGSAVCFISRTGDVQPCGYLPVKVGNVREKPLGQIWNESDMFVSLRDPSRLEGKCGSCGYRRLCAGCRARAYAASENVLGEDPDCSYDP